jgi:DNA-binding NarL/FixJ family response regulator
MFREIVRKVCAEDHDFEVVAEAGNGFEAIECIVGSKPDVVVLDLVLPELDGFAVLERIRQLGQHPRVLAISSHCGPYVIFRLEEARVQGFVDKRSQTLESLRMALDALRSNRSFFSETYLKGKSELRHDPLAFNKLLTKQQMTVLSLVAQQFADDAIAKHLGIGERTVETHRTLIMRKLEIHSRMELVHFAQLRGFIPCSPSESRERET